MGLEYRYFSDLDGALDCVAAMRGALSTKEAMVIRTAVYHERMYTDFDGQRAVAEIRYDVSYDPIAGWWIKATDGKEWYSPDLAWSTDTERLPFEEEDVENIKSQYILATCLELTDLLNKANKIAIHGWLFGPMEDEGE